MCALAFGPLEPVGGCRCGAGDSLHLRGGLSGAGERLPFIQHSAAAAASLLVGHSLDAIVNVVFAGDGGRLLVADVAVKTFEF